MKNNLWQNNFMKSYLICAGLILLSNPTFGESGKNQPAWYEKMPKEGSVQPKPNKETSPKLGELPPGFIQSFDESEWPRDSFCMYLFMPNSEYPDHRGLGFVFMTDEQVTQAFIKINNKIHTVKRTEQKSNVYWLNDDEVEIQFVRPYDKFTGHGNGSYGEIQVSFKGKKQSMKIEGSCGS